VVRIRSKTQLVENLTISVPKHPNVLTSCTLLSVLDQERTIDQCSGTMGAAYASARDVIRLATFISHPSHYSQSDAA